MNEKLRQVLAMVNGQFQVAVQVRPCHDAGGAARAAPNPAASARGAGTARWATWLICCSCCAAQELAATADQVVVIKGQAAAHKRAHDAAAADVQRLAQQVAQLEQLAAQLAAQLPQEAARRKVNSARLARWAAACTM
jgi:septal ring factor EnvC (AmiA/AmiB activator)